MLPFLLVFIGLILILVEFYLPGAIMGILGGISIAAGIVVFALQTSSIIALVLFIAVSVVSIIFLIRFAMWRIVHAKPQYSIYSAQNQEGYQAASYDESAIGKKGTVLSDLKPGGYILVDGYQQPAISISGYIPKGEQVIVISGQEQSLIVKLSKKEMNP